MSSSTQMRTRFLLTGFALVVIMTTLQQRTHIRNAVNLNLGKGTYETSQQSTKLPTDNTSSNLPYATDNAINHLLHAVTTTSTYFTDYPLAASDFGKMGRRIQILRDWMEAAEQLTIDMTNKETYDLRKRINKTALSMFPFLRSPSMSLDRFYFSTSGQKTFRYACHLIANLRDALHSQLPIEVVYAGNSDLPPEYREFIKSLGANIETIDITQVFDDTTLDLAHGGWAIKAFAALGSQYEQVMVLDADAVFLQAPEKIFDGHDGYRSTGALLFHDRLLWQGAFKQRHEWWEKQLEHHTPSASLAKSRVYNEGYAEECDSGVVVLDKGRLPVLLGLLHVAWQNTKQVREEWTYKMGYGDKESWWFGLELSGAEYAFEEHYGGMLGGLNAEGDKVCSFTIAHTDEREKLLWYNGSLLRNKAVNATAFDVPSHWMIDGEWEKGASKPDISYMREAPIQETNEEERGILRESVERAKDIDDRIEQFTTLT